MLDEATGRWGIRVNRVELKSVEPPRTVQEAMEKQMRAERDRRAAILTAEGVKQSQILTAEGEKQSAVLKAEGARTAAILRAEGEAKAIETVFQAIHDGAPDERLLSYQYLQMLPQLAQGAANKIFVIPTEFSQALGNSAARSGGAAATRPTARRGRAATPAPAHRGPPTRPTRRPSRAPRTRRGARSPAEAEAADARRRSAAPGRGSRRGPPRSRSLNGVFDSLAEKLQGTLAGVRQRGALTEDDINEAMREIRLALLEADVNFKVVKQFTADGQGARARRRGATQLNPGQQVVKIVNEELTALMGGQSARHHVLAAPADGDPDGRPAGLRQDDRDRQARALAARGAQARRSPSRPATSTARPRSSSSSRSAARPARRSTSRAPTATRSTSPRWALDQAKRDGKDVLIVDTSGRLHVDQALMEELAEHPQGDHSRTSCCWSSTR